VGFFNQARNAWRLMFEREMSEHIAGFEKHLHALRAKQYLFLFFAYRFTMSR
jgi:hypothetical protein